MPHYSRRPCTFCRITDHDQVPFPTLAVFHRKSVTVTPPVPQPTSLLRLFGLVFAFMLALVVALGVALFALVDTPYTGRDEIPFDRTKWLAAGEDGAVDLDGDRYLMVDDLLQRHKLVGMSRIEVENLLGPLRTAGYPSMGPCYYLGPQDSRVSLDNEWLVITFAGETVARALVLTD